MGDKQNRNVQTKDRTAPAWIAIVAAILSLISTVLVALVAYFGNVRVAWLQEELELLNAEAR